MQMAAGGNQGEKLGYQKSWESKGPTPTMSRFFIPGNSPNIKKYQGYQYSMRKKHCQIVVVVVHIYYQPMLSEFFFGIFGHLNCSLQEIAEAKRFPETASWAQAIKI